MTSIEAFDEETPLFTHICACCGDPIAARHEQICEAIIAIDAMKHGSNVEGKFTTIYCPACLVEALELTEIKIRNDVGFLLDF